ncbi:DoxX family protein [Citrobacter sp. R-1.5.2]|uniref:DoxX family protein n=1 Tax=Citrobacter sp. R-1.5.2 TaxID=3046183 RepID=UPI002B24E6BC|nr:DoxX family protein [Citrobacter sp. R-1.5.2]MEB2416682.1 DoxX family protein [Citrobacter sp. R-1.5.2]
MTQTIIPGRPVAIAPPRTSPYITAGLTALGLIGAIYAVATGKTPGISPLGQFFLIAWLAVSTAISLIVTPRNFVIGFLSGLLTLLIGWRIGGFVLITWVWIPCLLAFLSYLAQFVGTIRVNSTASDSSAISAIEWQLIFLRMYVGFDLVPHFTEKLFAGSVPYLADVNAFADLWHVPMAWLVVIIAGCCELATCIGIGMGLCTRLAAIGGALYYFFATLIGGHFSTGFIWLGGGWEYTGIMMACIGSFAFVGAGRFSLDSLLINSGRFPKSLRFLAIRH